MTLDHHPPEGHGPAPAIGVDLEERRPRCAKKRWFPYLTHRIRWGCFVYVYLTFIYSSWLFMVYGKLVGNYIYLHISVPWILWVRVPRWCPWNLRCERCKQKPLWPVVVIFKGNMFGNTWQLIQYNNCEPKWTFNPLPKVKAPRPTVMHQVSVLKLRVPELTCTKKWTGNSFEMWYACLGCLPYNAFKI